MYWNSKSFQVQIYHIHIYVVYVIYTHLTKLPKNHTTAQLSLWCSSLHFLMQLYGAPLCACTMVSCMLVIYINYYNVVFCYWIWGAFYHIWEFHKCLSWFLLFSFGLCPSIFQDHSLITVMFQDLSIKGGATSLSKIFLFCIFLSFLVYLFSCELYCELV